MPTRSNTRIQKTPARPLTVKEGLQPSVRDFTTGAFVLGRFLAVKNSTVSGFPLVFRKEDRTEVAFLDRTPLTVPLMAGATVSTVQVNTTPLLRLPATSNCRTAIRLRPWGRSETVKGDGQLAKAAPFRLHSTVAPCSPHGRETAIRRRCGEQSPIASGARGEHHYCTRHPHHGMWCPCASCANEHASALTPSPPPTVDSTP